MSSRQPLIHHQAVTSVRPSASRGPGSSRRWLALGLGALGLCLASSAIAHSGHHQPCSERTLRGTYLYEMIGRDRLPAGATTAGPYAEIGQDYFDGAGRVVTRISSSRDDHVALTGTYALAANCEGTIHYASPDGPPRIQQIYVAPDGQRLSFVEIGDPEAGAILAGERQRVAHRHPDALRCSPRTLAGTYTYNNNGAVMIDQRLHLIREAGMETYDGQGRMINRYTDSQGTRDTIAGRYELTPSCRGIAEYASGGFYRFYADPLGQSFVFVDATPGAQRSGRNIRVSLRGLVR